MKSSRETYSNLNLDLCWLFSPFSPVFDQQKWATKYLELKLQKQSKNWRKCHFLELFISLTPHTITLAQFWFFRSFSSSSHFHNSTTRRKDDHWRCRIKNQTVFAKVLYLFKSETMPIQFLRGKEETVIHGKKPTIFYRVRAIFFSIRPINRVQSQALNSEIKCEKKGIMNKWDAEKKCRQLVSIISKMTAVKGWEKKTKKSHNNSFKRVQILTLVYLSLARDSEL